MHDNILGWKRDVSTHSLSVYVQTWDANDGHQPWWRDDVYPAAAARRTEHSPR